MAKKEILEEAFYVGVREPIEIRKSLLESSKTILQFLQRFEKFKEVRMEKLQTIAILKEDIREIQKLTNKLKTTLPKTNLRFKLHEEHVEKVIEPVEEVKPQKQAKQKKKKEEEPKPEVRREASDIEKLEAELASIEEKLSSLT